MRDWADGLAMHTVTASDGTEIAYDREGTGPPLVLLHGTGVTRDSWAFLREHLASDFTLLVPDRRGRGASGDSEAYSLDRDVDDLAALLETVDGPTTVFGHSFGGLIGLRAAESLGFDRLVLYEPAMLTDADRTDGSMADRMAGLLAQGDRREAVKLFFTQAAGIDDVEALPIWPACVDLAETIVREVRAVERNPIPTDPAVSIPTLLLYGEDSPPHLLDSIQTLADRLGRAHLVGLDGVGHAGHTGAAERVAAQVRQFVRESA